MGAISASLARRGAALAIALTLLPGVAAPPTVLAVTGATPSETTLSAPTLNPKPAGETASLTATVTSGTTGDVEFYDNGALVGTVALNGSSQATYVVPTDASTGTHAIKAEYQGDATYAKSEATRNIEVACGQLP